MLRTSPMSSSVSKNEAQPIRPGRSRSSRAAWLIATQAVLLGVAIGVASFAQQLSFSWFSPGFSWPHLPNVAMVPWNPASDFFSSTAQLFAGLFISVAAALLLEPVKLIAQRRFSLIAYSLALLAQVAIFAETFVNACPDWASHAASLLLSRGTREFWMIGNTHPPLLGIALAIALILFEVLLLRKRFGDRQL